MLIEAAKQRPPECLLTDVIMPGMKGVERRHSLKTGFSETTRAFLSCYVSSCQIAESLIEDPAWRELEFDSI
jgi:FixJ family two-component response regulator